LLFALELSAVPFELCGHILDYGVSLLELGTPVVGLSAPVRRSVPVSVGSFPVRLRRVHVARDPFSG